MQVAAEVVVDVVSFYWEHKQGIPITGYYFERLSKSSLVIIQHMLSFLFSVHWVAYCFKTIPFAPFCSGAGDPCLCTKERGYELWYDTGVCGNQTAATAPSG